MKTDIAICVSICAFSAFIAWCAGYDFDHRSFAVAWWVACTVWFCGIGLLLNRARTI